MDMKSFENVIELETVMLNQKLGCFVSISFDCDVHSNGRKEAYWKVWRGDLLQVYGATTLECAVKRAVSNDL
jgi:hypothetical protein